LSVAASADGRATVARRRRRHPAVLAEDMEGYAVALAARLAAVPLAIVRGACNEAGERDPPRRRRADALAPCRAPLAAGGQRRARGVGRARGGRVMTLRFGISPCPNDTFAFHGLLTGTSDAQGLDLEIVLADVQELNERLARGDLAAGKASFAQALRLTRDFG